MRAPLGAGGLANAQFPRVERRYDAIDRPAAAPAHGTRVRRERFDLGTHVCEVHADRD